MSTTDLLLVCVGGLVVVLALADVFLAVLYEGVGRGFITPHVYRATWAVMRVVAAPMGDVRSAAFLSFAGPIMMVLTATTWFGLLLLGFTLIAWPALGDALQSSDSRTPLDFWAALYYAGYSLTTLGTGDIVPKTSLLRTLMVVQALLGFSVITLTLTYFMSVYSALVRRNTLAQALHHLSGGSGDATQLLINLDPAGSPDQMKSELTTLAYRALDLLESHHSYPVLHYFRMRDERYAMSRMVVLILQPLTLLKSTSVPDHRGLAASSAVTMLWGAGTDLLHQTGRSFLRTSQIDQHAPDDTPHFLRTRQRLGEAGIELDPDLQRTVHRYQALRDQWVPSAMAFAELMAHRWEAMECKCTAATS